MDEGLRCFRESADAIGLAGMLRTAAKVRHVLRDPAGTQAVLREAVALTTAGANPLAESGLELLQAEIGETPATRIASGMRAAELYRAMGIPAGEASALSRLAQAHADAGHVGQVLSVLRETQQVLRTARGHVLDPGRRSDHDFALRDVTTDLLTTAHALGAAGIETMAGLIVDEAPLGLRGALEDGHPSQATQEFISRIQGRSAAPVGSPPQPRAHLLQQLGAILATLEPCETPRWRTLADASSAHPGQALIAYAARHAMGSCRSLGVCPATRQAPILWIWTRTMSPRSMRSATLSSPTELTSSGAPIRLAGKPASHAFSCLLFGTDCGRRSAGDLGPAATGSRSRANRGAHGRRLAAWCQGCGRQARRTYRYQRPQPRGRRGRLSGPGSGVAGRA